MASTARRDDLLRSLTAGIAELTSSDAWQRWLKLQSRFHGYSFGNTLLIQRQRSDATRVAGFHTWRRLGRTVRRGEKGIWILAPVTRRTAVEREENDQQPEARVLSGFRPVSVFDVAQTEGKPLPEAPAQRLRGEAPERIYGRLVAAAADIGYSVDEHDLPGETNGDCSFAARRIRIEITNDGAHQTRTLAHELAHAMLHEDVTDRPLAELEAESIAYVVCNAVGLDTGGYSFGYVTGWSGGGNDAIAGIKAAAARIQHTASRILSSIEASEKAAA